MRDFQPTSWFLAKPAATAWVYLGVPGVSCCFHFHPGETVMKRFTLFMLTAALAVALPSYLAAGEGKKPQRPKPPVQAKAPQFDAKVLFARLDKDKDGKLNFEEFSVGLRHLHQMWVAKAPRMQMQKVQAFAGKVMPQCPWAKPRPQQGKAMMVIKKGLGGPQGCPMMAKGPQKGKPGQFVWGQFQGKCPHGKQFAKGPQFGKGPQMFHGGKQFAKGHPCPMQFGKCPWRPYGKQFAKGPQKGHPGQFAKGCPCQMRFGKCPWCPCSRQFAKGPQKGYHGKQFAKGPQKGHGGKYAWGQFQGKGRGPQFGTCPWCRHGQQFGKAPWGMQPRMAQFGMKPGMCPWGMKPHMFQMGMKPGMGPWGMGMPHMAHWNFQPGMGGPHWGQMPGPMPGMMPGMGQKPMAKKAPAMKKPEHKPDFKRPAPPKQPQPLKPAGKTDLERKVAELEIRLTAVERQQAAILTAIQEQQATMMAALQKTNQLVTAKLASMGRDTERVRPQWDKAQAEQKSRETAKAKHWPQPNRGDRD
jgi:hypothetical protein